MKKIQSIAILVTLFLTIPISGNSNIDRKFKANPLINRIVKELSKIYPGSIAASGLRQVLEREGPTIMNHLRQTRQAIESLGNGDLSYAPEPVRSKPFAFVKYEKDRQRLVRNFNDLMYLLDGYQKETNFSKKTEWLIAISNKYGQIDSIFKIYLGKSVIRFIAENSANFQGTWQCSGRGKLNITQSEIMISGSLSGQGAEHWSDRGRKGGSISGKVAGQTADVLIKHGDGTSATSQITFGRDNRSFSGRYTWWGKDGRNLGSGSWGCKK